MQLRASVNSILMTVANTKPLAAGRNPAPVTADKKKRLPSAGRISELALELDDRLAHAIERISNFNSETKFIAINARMEAMRAGGQTGKAFSVVAQAIQNVSQHTADVARKLSHDTHQTVTELREINDLLATRVLGERLSDLALTNIDLIDRNLYERTCDVRWWATDASFVQACTEPARSNLDYATRRLGQILDSYTVYFDIVLCDLEGRIIANGRPELYRSVGSCHADKVWFQTALNCSRADEFGFRSVSPSRLVNHERSVMYSCGVREEGQPDGRMIGVLAVIFRWDSLAQTIVERCPLTAEERPRTRVCIVNGEGVVLADTERQFGVRLDLPDLSGLFREPRNYAQVQQQDKRLIVGHAIAPGYETYSTGWHSLLIQTAEG